MSDENNCNEAERDVSENNTPVYDRLIEILEFKDEYPNLNWIYFPELVHMDIDDSGQISSIKGFTIFNRGVSDGLGVNIYYIPAELEPAIVKKISIWECECFSFDITDKQQEAKIRELYRPILKTGSDSKYIHITIKEVVEVFNYLLNSKLGQDILTEERKKALEKMRDEYMLLAYLKSEL